MTLAAAASSSSSSSSTPEMSPSELLKGRPSSVGVRPSLLKGSLTDDKGRAIPSRALGGENEDEGGREGGREGRGGRRRAIGQSSF